jgi:hypothetical protein
MASPIMSTSPPPRPAVRFLCGRADLIVIDGRSRQLCFHASACFPAGPGWRRFIDWVIEVDAIRGWRVPRSFRTSTSAGPSSWPWPCPLGTISSSSPPDLHGSTESGQRPSHGNARPGGWRGWPVNSDIRWTSVRHSRAWESGARVRHRVAPT